MCSVVILLRPGHKWPVLLAANRDEMANRPWLPPGRHWPDRPDIVAGRDLLADGSWFGVNDYGVVAILLNTPHTIGAAAGFRSRGELVLEALDHADADQALAALRTLNSDAYRPFHLLILDNRDAVVLSHLGDGGRLLDQKLAPGLSMITAHGLNAPESARFRRWFPAFQQADVPNPAQDNWDGWRNLMLARDFNSDLGPMEAMFVQRADGFGTRSTAFIAVPDAESAGHGIMLRHLEHS